MCPNTPQEGSPGQPTPPQLHAWMVALLSALVCGWMGNLIASTSGFTFTPPASGMILGGIIGLTLGLIFWLDDRSTRRQIEARRKDAEGAPADGPSAPAPGRPTEVFAVLLLVFPVVGGVLIWQRESLGLSPLALAVVSVATVAVTALLGYVDLRLLYVHSLGETTDGRPPPTPITAFACILALWVVGYPLHFLARRRLGGRNLIPAGLVAAAVFLVPGVLMWFSGPDLPQVGAPEVLAVVRQTIEAGPVYQAKRDQVGPLTLGSPVQISFDRERQRRVARLELSWKGGQQTLFYTVQWQDRSQGMFFVEVFDREP